MNELSPILKQQITKIALSSERIVRHKGIGATRTKAFPDEVLGEVSADLEHWHRRLREDLGYKRKEIDVDQSNPAVGRLSTNDFDYEVSLDLVSDKSSEIRWLRQISLVADRRGPLEDKLVNVFSETFDTITVQFSQALDIAEVVDRIEEYEGNPFSLDYDLNCTWCELTIADVPAKVRLEGRELHVNRPAGTAVSLADLYRLIQPGVSQ